MSGSHVLSASGCLSIAMYLLSLSLRLFVCLHSPCSPFQEDNQEPEEHFWKGRGGGVALFACSFDLLWHLTSVRRLTAQRRSPYSLSGCTLLFFPTLGVIFGLSRSPSFFPPFLFLSPPDDGWWMMDC